MKNTFGSSVSVTIFGESHGSMIGAVLDGLAPGVEVDEAFIAKQMSLRKAVGSISTARHEADSVRIVSGVFNGKTTGTPITMIIENQDTRSRDYGELAYKARPGHADFTAFMKYHGFQDFRGGGHFSGRITAGLVAAGAIAINALKAKNIFIGTHILSCAGITDSGFSSDIKADIEKLNNSDFAVLDDSVKDKMISAVEAARREGNSVGGRLETVVSGFPAGVGEPWFDTLESVLSHIIFSIPAVKGVEFGDGFSLSDMKAARLTILSEAAAERFTPKQIAAEAFSAEFSNGMPIIIRTAVKPTPSIYTEQKTVDLNTLENTTLQIKGRHDPAIIHRARVVLDSAVALALCDQLALRFGTDWFTEKN